MNILLGITGSVAATLTPKLCRELMKVGKVKVVATDKSRYFFDYFTVEDILQGSPGDTECYSSDTKIYFDQQEWSGYSKNQDIPHITLGDWANVFVVAPLTANTLNKIAVGIADNLLTSLYLAWHPNKPIVIAPAMNTRMWNHSTVQSSLDRLSRRHNSYNKLSEKTLQNHRLDIVPPISKKLACGDEGIGAMADINDIVSIVKTLNNRE